MLLSRKHRIEVLGEVKREMILSREAEIKRIQKSRQRVMCACAGITYIILRLGTSIEQTYMNSRDQKSEAT